MLPTNNEFYIELGKYIKYYHSCIHIVKTAIPMIEKYKRISKHSYTINNAYHAKWIRGESAIRNIGAKFRNISYNLLNSIDIDTSGIFNFNIELTKLGYITNKDEYTMILDSITYTFYRVMALIRLEGYDTMNHSDIMRIHFLYIPIAPRYFKKILHKGKSKYGEQFDCAKIVFDGKDDCLMGPHHIFGIELSGYKRDWIDKDFQYRAKFIISDKDTVDIENYEITQYGEDLIVKAETDSKFKHVYFIYFDVDNKHVLPSGSMISKSYMETCIGGSDHNIAIVEHEKLLYLFTDSFKENRDF